jgi:EAL domain-containing protein (putative c-di-GMP-specific phosphodiesterase class I)
VAEGVEDDETGAALAALGCDTAQGYAIARPMPVDDFLRWLESPGGWAPRRTAARAGSGRSHP